MKLSIIILMCFISTVPLSFTNAQMVPESVFPEGRENSISNSKLNTNLVKESLLRTPTSDEMSFLMFRDRVTGTLQETLTRRQVREEYNFNPVKSLNGNIKFGGFWDGGVNLYFAPEMYIKPFDGVSIYAIRQSHIYIPLEKMKENIKPLLIETVCLAAIENAVNYFTINNKVLNGILNFALKNGFTLLSNAAKSSEQKKLPSWEYYYCSVGIRF